METIYPTTEEIVEINKKVGGDGKFIHQSNLEFTLDKAKNARTLTKKAATILEGIVTGHPFIDGNKRTAFVAMELFLEKNGKKIEHSTASEHLTERVLYDIAENRISSESLEKIISELIK